MIGTVLGVARGEGIASVFRRAGERVREGRDIRAALARGRAAEVPKVALLNVHASVLAARHGGVQVQLIDRLREESSMREWVLLHPGVLASGGNAWESPPFLPSGDAARDDFELALEDALDRTGARAIAIDGTAGVPIGSILGVADERKLDVILSIHDFSLFTTAPHQFSETSSWDSSGRVELAKLLLQRAAAVIFPSTYLQRCHEQMLDLTGMRARVIAPGVRGEAVPPYDCDRRRIAFVGSVRRHKGGHLLPDIINATPRARWHVFGGGDEEVLRALRRMKHVTLHGYYSAGKLPSLLRRHRIGLAVMPSIVPESFGLTLSECWLAGVPAITFGHGAQAERIRAQGGGWTVPVVGGVSALARIANQWLEGQLQTRIPSSIPTARDAAAAHVALYRELKIEN